MTLSPRYRLQRLITKTQIKNGPVRAIVGNTLGFMGRSRGGPIGSRVAMFHFGRCGSTVLANMLNSDPSLHWDNEPLSPRLERIHFNPHFLDSEVYDRKTFNREIRRRFFWAGKRRYGAEITQEQFQLYGIQDASEAREILETNGYGIYISLVRKNVLRQLISSLRAIRSGQLHINIDEQKRVKSMPLDIDPAEFRVHEDQEVLPLEEHLALRQRSIEWLKNAAGTDALHLDFETHVMNDPRVGYNLICEHIGIEPQTVAPSLKRTNPQPVEQLVANPELWRKRLSGTEFDWMMDAD